jgi:protein SCO1/2
MVHPRLRLALGAVVALVVVTLAAVVIFGGGRGTATASTSSPTTLEGGQIDIPARNFSLVDQDGHRATLAQYRGQVVILTFMYSTCQNTCPVEAQQIRGALDELGQSVPTLAVSVDPSQDTPINAQRFLFKESLSGRMRFLLGTRAQLAPIWHAYGIAPETATNIKDSNHSAYVMLVDRNGQLRDGFPDSELTPEALAHDIRILQAE